MAQKKASRRRILDKDDDDEEGAGVIVQEEAPGAEEAGEPPRGELCMCVCMCMCMCVCVCERERSLLFRYAEDPPAAGASSWTEEEIAQRYEKKEAAVQAYHVMVDQLAKEKCTRPATGALLCSPFRFPHFVHFPFSLSFPHSSCENVFKTTASRHQPARDRLRRHAAVSPPTHGTN